MKKNLRDILHGYLPEAPASPGGQPVTSIAFDSRKVEQGSLFVAVRGKTTDGHLFIGQAIKNGATAVVCEELPDHRPENIPFIRVHDSAETLGHAASRFHGEPSKKIKLIGITGTNGKTTIANLLYNLFQTLGYPAGLVSTVGNMIGQRQLETSHTTPDPVTLNGLFSQMAEAGCSHAFMEVSSHATVQKRIAGLTFSGGVFTNLSHEHLDYHKTFRAYLEAKKSFFDGLPGEAFALTNLDDKNGMVMLQNTRAVKKTYSLRTMADFRAKVLEFGFEGTHLRVGEEEVWSKLIGTFNVYNLLAAFGVASLLGEDPAETLRILSNTTPAEGRFDHFRLSSGAMAIVDYAHTPDALENVLETIIGLKKGPEQLITVLGCGGDRDAAKRPVMASLAARHSDRVIITSDNPRTEDPGKIIEEMKTGLDHGGRKKTLSILNRKEAIEAACAMAGRGDIILVAGKGHEKYQEINGVRYAFDDKRILKEALNG